jgi:hypothetical protein
MPSQEPGEEIYFSNVATCKLLVILLQQRTLVRSTQFEIIQE